MSVPMRFVAAVVVTVACHVAFPLALGAGGALQLLERQVDDRWAVVRADAGIRLLARPADPEVDPLLVFVEAQSPRIYRAFVITSFFAPGLVFFVFASLVDSAVRVWLGAVAARRSRGVLPPWPLHSDAAAPALCIGEIHHKTKLGEAAAPKWLMMPEKGLYTGLAIFGAIGTGKTTSCMRPFARQLLEWQCHDPARRVAALRARGQGRLLLRRPGHAQAVRPFRRLHGDIARGVGLAVESAQRPVARYLLVGLYHRGARESALRQEQGALLAAGLYERFALDHGGVPRQDRPSLVHARRRLPVAARQAAPRDHDR